MDDWLNNLQIFIKKFVFASLIGRMVMGTNFYPFFEALPIIFQINDELQIYESFCLLVHGILIPYTFYIFMISGKINKTF